MPPSAMYRHHVLLPHVLSAGTTTGSRSSELSPLHTATYSHKSDVEKYTLRIHPSPPQEAIL